MTQLSIESAKQSISQELELAHLQASEAAAFMASTRAAQKPTGIKWIDALNASVRPVVTYWWFALYSLVKLWALLHGGELWGAFDQVTFGAIINFWFLDRVISKRAI